MGLGGRCGCRLRRPRRDVGECLDHVAQRPRAEDLTATDDACLVEAEHRHDDCRTVEGADERQRPGDGANRAVEAELADERVIDEPLGRQLVGGREDADGDREIEPGTRFGQAGRCEVDGEPALRPLLLTRQQRGPHPVTRLATRGVGQPDDGVGRQSTGGMHFDGYAVTFDAEQRRR